MRVLAFVTLASVSLMLGQEAATPLKPSDRWTLGVPGFKAQDAKPARKAPIPQVSALLGPSSSYSPVCSVPLLRAEIPQDVENGIIELAPPTGFTDGMRAVIGIPTCGASPGTNTFVVEGGQNLEELLNGKRLPGNAPPKKKDGSHGKPL